MIELCLSSAPMVNRDTVSLAILCALSIGTLGAVLLTSQFKKDVKAAGGHWPSLGDEFKRPTTK